MDFSKLDTKADAEAGSFVHFTHPQLRHYLYTGDGANEFGELINEDLAHEAVGALVRGMESDKARAVIAKSNARSAKGDTEESGIDLAVALVIELRGVTNGEKPVKSDEKDLRWFFGRSDDFAVQVINHARNRRNFFNAASKG
jgi:hypothetical protein